MADPQKIFEALAERAENFEDTVKYFNGLDKKGQADFLNQVSDQLGLDSQDEMYLDDSAVSAVKRGDKNAKLYSDEDALIAKDFEGPIGTAGAAVHGFSDTVLGGIPKKVGAGVITVGEHLFSEKAEDEDLSETYNRVLSEGNKRSRIAKEYNIIGDTIGAGLGYMLDPLTKLVRGFNVGGKIASKGLKMATSGAAEVASIETQKATVETLDQLARTDKPISKILKQEAVDLGLDVALGFTGGAVAGTIASPIKSVTQGIMQTFAKPMSKLRQALPGYSESKKFIVDNLEKAAKLDTKNAVNKIKNIELEISNYYRINREALNNALGSNLDDASAMAGSMLENQQKLLDDLADDAIKLLKREAKPDELADNIGAVSAVASQFRKTASDNYARALDKLTESNPSKVSIADIVESTYADMANTGQGTFVDGKFKLLGGDAITRKFIETDLKELSAKNLSIKDIAQLKTKIGSVINWADKTSFTPLKTAWFNLKDRITENLDDAGKQYFNEMSDSWRIVAEAQDNVIKTSKNFGKLSALAGSVDELAEESFEKQLSSNIKRLQTMYDTDIQLAAKSSQIGKLNTHEQSLVKNTLTDLKKAYDINKVSKKAFVRKELLSIVKDENKLEKLPAERLSNFIDISTYDYKIRDLVKNFDGYEQIKAALDEPFNKNKIETALNFVAENMNSVEPELKSALFRVANFSRRAASDNKLYNILDVIKGENPNVVDEILVAVNIEPKIKEMLTNANLLKAMSEVAPDILTAIREPGIQASEVALGGVAANAALNQDPASIAVLKASAGILTGWRLFNNPQAVMLTLQKLENKMSPKVSRELAEKIARAASTAQKVLNASISRQQKPQETE